MSLVQMNCKNCGAPLEKQGGEYVCKHCGARVLSVLDASVETGAEVIGAEEFERELQKRKSAFAVDFGTGYRVFEGATEVINGQIRQAARFLQSGKSYAVEEALRGVPDTVFAAERLRLLAAIGAKDEAELSYWAGNLHKTLHFERVLALADHEQRRVYERLAEVCAENARIAREIGEGMRLVEAQAYEDAERYGAVMCAKFAACARAWELLIAARCGRDRAYDPSADLAKCRRCPDFSMAFGEPLEGEDLPRSLSPLILERWREMKRKKQATSKWKGKFIGGLITAAGIALLVVIWTLIEKALS